MPLKLQMLIIYETVMESYKDTKIMNINPRKHMNW